MWKTSKQKQRDNMTPQRKRRINERRRQIYAAKKEARKVAKGSQSTKEDKGKSEIPSGYSSKEAERKAVYKAKASIPSSYIKKTHNQTIGQVQLAASMIRTQVSRVTRQTIFVFIGLLLPFALGGWDDCISTGCVNGDCVVGAPPACVCRPGFIPTVIDTICEDINECVSNPCFDVPPSFPPIVSRYGPNTCENTQGSYRCLCNSPYFPSFNGTQCINGSRGLQQQNSFLQTLIRLSLLGFNIGDIFGF